METVRGLSKAAEERYWDALELAVCVGPRRTAAVYLFGYVAELVLKTALYRAMGAAQGHDVNASLPTTQGKPLRLAAKKELGLHVSASRSWNFHDIDLIYAALEARRDLTKPIDPRIQGALKKNIPALAEHWAEWLRYRPETATKRELVDVFRLVDFLFIERKRL